MYKRQAKADIVESLIFALENELDWRVRQEICWALGKIKDQTAIFALREQAVKDPSASVRKSAIWAMAEIDPDEAKKLAEALLPLETKDQVKKELIWILAKTGDFESLAQLYSVLPHEKGEIQRLIVWAIGKISAPQSWTILEKTIQSKKIPQKAKEEAIWALAKWAPAKNVVKLLPLLKKRGLSIDTKKMIIWALAQRGTRAVLKKLSRLKIKNPILKEEIAWAKRQIELGE